ncbi:Pycsar system effector family protein [Streptomyces sp. NPDC051742]|uniref:Pycsar system effector family protein n=1 Tax=unclassified Streptomyces TaxID=2593676 RepID=UPI003441623E
MSDEDESAPQNDAPEAGQGNGGRADAPGGGQERGDEPGGGGRQEREGDRPGGAERTDGTAEQPREPNVFASADLGSPGGDTGGAATARRAVRTWAGGGADRLTTIHGDGTVFEGNQIFALGGSDRSPHFVQGPVPPETLDHLGRVYCATAGYGRMRDRLRDHRVLVLCGEPGSGRKATALALLAELTDGKVFRLDPRHGVDELTEEVLQESGGHLLELPAEDVGAEDEPHSSRAGRGERNAAPRRPATRLSELHLDRFGDLLRGRDAYGVVLVENGELADRLLRGRYGMYCAPPPADEVLQRHLWHRLRAESDEALGAARARAAQRDVVDALGLEELRPREAARLADHLARHWRGEVTDERLLAECASFVRSQAREWFAGADRPGALPEALPAQLRLRRLGRRMTTVPGPAPERVPGAAPAPAPRPAPRPAPVPPEELRFMAERLLATVREDIGRADTKAAILLSGALAFLAVVFSGDGALLSAQGAGRVFLLVAGVLWTAGVLMLVSVVLPRTRVGADRTMLRDLAAGPSAPALRGRLSASGADATDWLLEQAGVHGLVLAAKYRWLRLGVCSLALGALLALLSELW